MHCICFKRLVTDRTAVSRHDILKLMNKAKAPITAKRAIGTSIAVSVSDIVLNLLVAIASGSVIMLAQALQGAADLTTAGLLMIGVKRSNAKPDATHPFGFGREVFFWTLMASVFAFFVTGGISIMRGIDQALNPGVIENTGIAFAMLFFGLATNGYSLSLSLRRLARGNKKASLWDYILRSSLVETKTSLLVDLMGTLSAALGLFGLLLFQLTDNVRFDGLGALAVGILTALGALMLIYNIRGFIIGISPSQDVIERINKVALGVDGVEDILDLRAVMIGSDKLLVIIEAHFSDRLSTDEIERITDVIKQELKQNIPIITRVQVEAETPDSELISKGR